MQPSSQPSRQPTSVPSGQPTSRPSTSKPTSSPTSRPTLQPATSQPTLDGVTNPPSNFPTSAPTADYNYRLSKEFAQYNALKGTAFNSSVYVAFGSMNYKGIYTDGFCPDWNAFLVSQLTVPQEGVVYSGLSVNFYRYDVATKGNKTLSVTCRHSLVVSGIRKALLSGGSYSEYCAGYTWRAFTCNQQPVFCVNCRKTCVETDACPGSSFIINPCSSCQRYGIGYGFLRQEYSIEPLYPSFWTFSVSNTSRTSITVSFNISAAGNVYCAAFSTAAALSTAAVRSAGQKLTVQQGGVFSLTVTGLAPDTRHRILCFSEDLSNHAMPLAVATQSGSANATTLCCRRIVVSSNPGSVVQFLSSAASSRTETTFQFSLDSAPSRSTQVALKVYGAVCSSGALPSSTADVVTVPSAFVVTSNASSLVLSFVLRSASPGCFVVAAVANTLRQSDYFSPANMTISVRNVRANPPAPSFVAAAFNSDGTQLVLSFGSATSQAPTLAGFNCSLLFDFTTASRSTCFWQNSTVLIATLPVATLSQTAPYPVVGSSVVLRSGVLQAECVSGTTCASYAFSARTAVAVAAPVSPVRPVASLIAPSTITACEALWLDGSQTGGAGARPWASFSLAVAASDASAQNVSLLQSYLTANFRSPALPLKVPADYLVPGRTYTLRLLVSNLFGAADAAQATVAVTTSQQPVLRLSVLGVQKQYSSAEQVFLTAEPSYSLCGGAFSNVTYSYVWSVFSGSRLLSTSLSQAADPRQFVTPPYSFLPSNTYQLSVLVQARFTGSQVVRRAWAFATLSFAAKGLLARIAGPVAFDLSASSSYLLNATASQDLDYPDAALSFVWSCTVLSAGDFGSSCLDSAESADEPQFLRVPAQRFSEGIYRFSVAVSNPSRADSDVVGASIASVTVTVRRQSQMPVWIRLSTPPLRVNPTDRVSVTATVDCKNATDTLLTWTSDRIAVLGSAASSPVQAIVGAGATKFPLTFAPFTLQAGASYAFTLTASPLSGGSSATATFSLEMNAPPYGGALTVSPTAGTAGSTLFALTATQWSDTSADDFPLRFAFVYRPFSGASLADVVTLREMEPSAVLAATSLGPGRSAEGNVVTCVVRVFDQLLSAANASFDVTVSPFRSSTFAVTQASSMLSSAVVLGSPTAIQQALLVGLQSVGAASSDCSALSTSCSSLNREPCGSVARTCGSCLAGYVGVDGPSNLPCQLSGSLRGVGESCASNSTCFSGRCSLGRCATTNQTCPASCSGRGLCVWLDVADASQRRSSCSVTDTTCRASCVCSSGFFGSDCGTAAETRDRVVAFREAVCSALRVAAEQQAAVSQAQGAAVLLSQSNTVHAALEEDAFVSSAALRDCAAVLLTSLQRAAADIAADALVATAATPALCVSQGIAVVSRAVSRAVQRADVRGNSSLAQSLVDAETRLLTKGCRSQIVLNDSPLDVVSGTRRLQVAAVSGGVLATAASSTASNSSLALRSVVSTTFSLPQTPAESFLAVAPTRVAVALVASSASSADDELQVALLADSFVASSAAVATLTNVTALQLSLLGTLGTASTSAARRLATSDGAASRQFALAVTLQNRAAVAYVAIAPARLTLRCDWRRAASYNLTATCPDGRLVSLVCPPLRTGSFEVDCPGRRSLPQCLRYDAASDAYAPASNCTLQSYSASNTTCRCLLTMTANATASTSTTARRRLQLADTQSDGQLTLELSTRRVVQVLNMAGEVVSSDPLATRFVSDDPLGDLQLLSAPGPVAQSLAILALAGLLLLGWTDALVARRQRERQMLRALEEEQRAAALGKGRAPAGAALDLSGEALQLLDDKERAVLGQQPGAALSAKTTPKKVPGASHKAHGSAAKVVPTADDRGADDLDEPSYASLAYAHADGVLMGVRVRRIEFFLNALCPPAFRPGPLALRFLRRVFASHSLLSLLRLALHRLSLVARRCSSHSLATVSLDVDADGASQRRGAKKAKGGYAIALASPLDEEVDAGLDPLPTLSPAPSVAAAPASASVGANVNGEDGEVATAGFALLSLRLLRALTLLLVCLCGSLVALRLLYGRVDSCAAHETQAACADAHSSLVTELRWCSWDAPSFSCVARDPLLFPTPASLTASYAAGGHAASSDEEVLRRQTVAMLFLASLAVAATLGAVDMCVGHATSVLAHCVAALQVRRVRRALYLRHKALRQKQRFQKQKTGDSRRDAAPQTPQTPQGSVRLDGSVWSSASAKSAALSGAPIVEYSAPTLCGGGALDFDEFRAAQSTAGLLLRGVRLAQLQTQAEHSSVGEEAALLTRLLRLLRRHREIHHRDTATHSARLNRLLRTQQSWYEAQRWSRLFPWLGLERQHEAAPSALHTLAGLRRKTLALLSHCEALALRHKLRAASSDLLDGGLLSASFAPDAPLGGRAAPSAVSGSAEQVVEAELLRVFLAELFPAANATLWPEHWLVVSHLRPSSLLPAVSLPPLVHGLLQRPLAQSLTGRDTRRGEWWLQFAAAAGLLLWLGGIAALTTVSLRLAQVLSSQLLGTWAVLLALLVAERWLVTEPLVALLACVADGFVAADFRRLLEHLMRHARTLLGRSRGVVLRQSAQSEAALSHYLSLLEDASAPLFAPPSAADSVSARSSVSTATHAQLLLRHTGSQATVERRGPSSVLLQHLNAACRAARHLPQLPVARLLMSLNDADVSAVLASDASTAMAVRHGVRVATAWTLGLCLYAPHGLALCLSAWLSLFVSRGVVVAVAVLVEALRSGDGERLALAVAALGLVALWLLLPALLSAADAPHLATRSRRAAADKELLRLQRRYRLSASAPSRRASLGGDEERKEASLLFQAQALALPFGPSGGARKAKGKDVFSELDDDLASLLSMAQLGGASTRLSRERSPSPSPLAHSPQPLDASLASFASFASFSTRDDPQQSSVALSRAQFLPQNEDEARLAQLLLAPICDRRTALRLATLRDRVSVTLALDLAGAAGGEDAASEPRFATAAIALVASRDKELAPLTLSLRSAPRAGGAQDGVAVAWQALLCRASLASAPLQHALHLAATARQRAAAGGAVAVRPPSSLAQLSQPSQSGRAPAAQSPEHWRSFVERVIAEGDEGDDRSLVTQVRDEPPARQFVARAPLSQSARHDHGGRVRQFDEESLADESLERVPLSPSLEFLQAHSVDGDGDGDSDGGDSEASALDALFDSGRPRKARPEPHVAAAPHPLDQLPRSVHSERLFGPPLPAMPARLVGAPLLTQHSADFSGSATGAFEFLVQAAPTAAPFDAAPSGVDEAAAVKASETMARRYQRAHPRLSVTLAGRVFSSPARAALSASGATPNAFVRADAGPVGVADRSPNGGFRFRKYAGRRRQREELMRSRRDAQRYLRHARQRGLDGYDPMRSVDSLASQQSAQQLLAAKAQQERHFAPGERGAMMRPAPRPVAAASAAAEELDAWRGPGHVLRLEARPVGGRDGYEAEAEAERGGRRLRVAREAASPAQQSPLRAQSASSAFHPLRSSPQRRSLPERSLAPSLDHLDERSGAAVDVGGSSQSRLLEEDQILAILGLL